MASSKISLSKDNRIKNTSMISKAFGSSAVDFTVPKGEYILFVVKLQYGHSGIWFIGYDGTSYTGKTMVNPASMSLSVTDEGSGYITIHVGESYCHALLIALNTNMTF